MQRVIPSHSRRMSVAATALSLLLLVTLVGCAPGLQQFTVAESGVRPGATVAFLPLGNLTSSEAAGNVFVQKLLVELGALDHFRIQDPGLVSGALRQLRILDPDRMSAEQMESLASRVGADYLLVGVVTDYAEGKDRPRGLPVVAITLRLIDASNGLVIWAGSASREGDDGETFFGIGRIRTADRLAAVISHQLAQSMRNVCRVGPPLDPARRASLENDR